MQTCVVPECAESWLACMHGCAASLCSAPTARVLVSRDRRSSLSAVCPIAVGLSAAPRLSSTLCAEFLAGGIAAGTLGGTVASPTVVMRTPTRELLMAAMQQRGISLPAFDGIVSGGAFIPVERLWADMGGAPRQVRSGMIAGAAWS